MNTSPTSVTARWDPPNLEDQNGQINTYHLFLADEKEGNRNWTLSTTDVMFRIDFLQEYYRYSLRVAAETVALGPQSSPLNFITLQDSMWKSTLYESSLVCLVLHLKDDFKLQCSS